MSLIFFPGKGYLAWPYDDLPLRSGLCPRCQQLGNLLAAPAVYPTAWCSNEDCPVLTWDPTLDRAALLDGEQIIDLGDNEQTGPSSV